MRRKFAIALIVAALLSWLCQVLNLSVPVLKLFGTLDGDGFYISGGIVVWGLAFAASLWAAFRFGIAGAIALTGVLLAPIVLSFFPSLGAGISKWPALPVAPLAPGHILRLLAVGIGCWLLLKPAGLPNPLTQKRWKRFRSIRRGYISAWLIGILIFLACLDNFLVGKQALVVRYNGNWYFPFVQKAHTPETFGQKISGPDADYRQLDERFEQEKNGNFVLMPLIPYDARLDTPQQTRSITERDGKLFEEDSTREFRGLVYTVYRDKPDQRRRDYRVRKGIFHGVATGYDPSGSVIEKLEYRDGQLISHQKLSATADYASLDQQALPDYRAIVFPPAAPSARDHHYLGTDSRGADIVAILYDGFQLLVAAAIMFVLLVYTIGVVIGCLQGYFGGAFDLLSQRVVEIWSVLPFLYVVILLRSVVEQPTLFAIVLVMAAFSWMGLTYYMRGATLAEKARDYVSAAKILGAGTGRIVFNHILPNVLSTLVTKLPFTIEAMVASLTALDYLGFGLPAGEPSWGVLLRDGVSNMHCPWILLSAFFAIVFLMTLITFVGEAIREAFDPRKFTVYR